MLALLLSYSIANVLRHRVPQLSCQYLVDMKTVAAGVFE